MDYLTVARKYCGGREPAPAPGAPGGAAPRGALVCFFCAGRLPEAPDWQDPVGDGRRCPRCGGEHYDTPGWVIEVTEQALAANRRRPVPAALSKDFSAAVLAGDERRAREVLAEIEHHTGEEVLGG